MNHELIKQLATIKEEGTLYFRNRVYQTDHLDLASFQVLSDYLKAYGGKAKMDTYYDLLRCWYYVLLRIKEEEYLMKTEPSTKENELFFYNLVKSQQVLTKEEIMIVLYRLPWHLRTLLIASTEETFNEEFIHEAASVHVLEEMDFGDLGYLALVQNDHWAIETIQDDFVLGNEAKLTYQIKENLSLIPFTLEHYETFLKNEKETIREEDEHGLDILAFLLDMYREKNVEFTAFQFVLFTLSAMCFWHFEASSVKSTWFIKEGVFKHLKRFESK